MNIYKALASIKNGSMFSIKYQSLIPLTANSRKNGIEIKKITSKVTRTGIRYSNIKGVEHTSSDRKPIYDAVIANKLYKSIKNPSQEYVRIAKVNKHSYSKSEYVMLKDGKEIKRGNINDFKEFILPSYFNGKKEEPIVQNLKIENIIEINHQVID